MGTPKFLVDASGYMRLSGSVQTYTASSNAITTFLGGGEITEIADATPIYGSGIICTTSTLHYIGTDQVTITSATGVYDGTYTANGIDDTHFLISSATFTINDVPASWVMTNVRVYSDAAATLTSGQPIEISGTVNYNGTWTASLPDIAPPYTFFLITTPFVGDDAAGTVTTVSSAGSSIYTMPEGRRPSGEHRFVVPTDGTTGIGLVTVNAGGIVPSALPGGGDETTWYLDSVNYPVGENM
jgi:hypothetical protein